MKTKLHILFCLLAVCLGASAASSEAEKARREAAESYRLGEDCYARRQYGEAMTAWLGCLRLCEKAEGDTLQPYVFTGIGNIYSSHGDYDLGMEFYRKALAALPKGKNRTLRNRILNNLIGSSCFSGRLADGRRYLALMAENREPSADYRYNLLMGQGLVASCSDQPSVAASCYRRAVELAVEEKMADGCAEAAYSCLAFLFSEQAKPDSALHYLRINETAARAKGKADLLAETLKLMSEVYADMGLTGKALACKSEYVDLSDSLAGQENLNKIKNAQFRFDAERSHNTIRTLTQENLDNELQIHAQRRWLLTITVSSVVFLLLFCWAWVQKRRLRDAYNELYDRSRLLLDAPTQPSSVQPSAQTSSASLLTEEQREKILTDIRHLMAETNEFYSADFTLDKLAMLIGSNSRYVSEAINEGFGKNFRTLLGEYRVAEAMKRLADSEHYGDYTIKAIAESVGYKSASSFITVFTKCVGIKPSVYQKIARERE